MQQKAQDRLLSDLSPPVHPEKPLKIFLMSYRSMPLSAARDGQRVRILSLPSHPALEQRLASMGVKPGSEVEVLRRGYPGGILHVACGMLEFMLRQDQAKDMQVAPIVR
jgi:ferrous iron transport protein A